MREPLDANPTTYPVSDFLAWQRQGLLDLRPPYQRLSVWTKRAKSLLIDSVFRGYPIPLIFLHNSLDLDRAVSIRQVIDGQQRIRTLLAFIDSSCLDDRSDEDDFVVLKSHNEDFQGLTFGELPEGVRARILETSLPTVVLPSVIPDVEILRIFQRMNSTGLKLNPQEHRNAEYSGEFKDLSYALAYSQHQRWLSWRLFDTHQIARMLEVEFTSDILGLMLGGVRARTKATIDKLYRDNDTYLADTEVLADVFSDICDQLDRIFGGERSPSSLRRFRSTAWIYSCFAILSNADVVDIHGGTRIAGQSVPRIPLPDDVVKALQASDESIRAGNLDDTALKFLRGATSDRVSREGRIAFIREHL